ncbi:MAG: DegT/DnrJ/EryC1/StrS aminotransferase family protein [Betaproteobacteria bacterium]|jgi:dTDP-4-amino-4,6-dideoxygalactose transaminase|nr:DegT/DnrJ/EryC1/StrS aminotransferase family protein [Betaproteobacteria bacterium]
MNQLPFLPFTKPSIDEATIAAVGDVLRSGWITTGPQCQQLESALSELFGGRPVRCFANGTATMEVALRVAGIGPGDEVITTPISWVSTANVILTVGAKPVFVDIDLSTRNLNLELVKAAITPATKAIMPVYLSGLPVDIDQLYEIADHYQLRVIEDAAQALGSHWQGNLIGSAHQHRSDLVSFSFQANKNMTSIEGGCLVMNHADEANLAQRLRLQGVTRTGLDGMEVDVLGGKHNMTDVNAVIGIHQLAQLSEFMVKRKALVKHYFQLFEQSKLIEYGVILPLADMHDSNWHMFQVLLPIEQLKTRNQNRSTVMQALKDLGIGTGVHYPIITDFKLYKNLGYQSTNTPVAQQVGQAILTLPLFPLMTNQNVERVVHSLENVFAQFH